MIHFHSLEHTIHFDINRRSLLSLFKINRVFKSPKLKINGVLKRRFNAILLLKTLVCVRANFENAFLKFVKIRKRHGTFKIYKVQKAAFDQNATVTKIKVNYLGPASRAN